ncbi:MAG: hypothetical protein OEO20_12900 [Gemmatimonadota bacterium]|nr:hypothetical protein [Gemmatimonadota bacterium]MDH3367056.1 hypothetical protein [Gemmatimonadota bacterium]MDH3479194.1 hypothetical protein [Gemmatimonadota bacterium]MDH3569992.1 hypothetical protein [Gemmatimonadota bacterium]MDH5548583.1 hypothetical protein [Gemmatimonadota bacterium]
MMDEREQMLEQLAPRLGAEAADRIDAEHVAAAVTARLRARPVRRQWWQRARLVQLAAAAAVVLAVGFGIRELARPSDGRQAGAVPVEIQELAVAELSEVLDSLRMDAPVSDLVPVGLDDLDENELTQLLKSMEG